MGGLLRCQTKQFQEDGETKKLKKEKWKGTSMSFNTRKQKGIPNFGLEELNKKC